MDENKAVTKDIYLAAAYLAIGAVLDDTIRDDPRHLRFVFDLSGAMPVATTIPDLLEQLKASTIESLYTNGKLMVSASKYAESIRHLKSIIHATD